MKYEYKSGIAIQIVEISIQIDEMVTNSVRLLNFEEYGITELEVEAFHFVEENIQRFTISRTAHHRPNASNHARQALGPHGSLTDTRVRGAPSTNKL